MCQYASDPGMTVALGHLPLEVLLDGSLEGDVGCGIIRHPVHDGVTPKLTQSF